MKFYTVRDLRTQPKNIWTTLEEQQQVIITNNGKPTALMISIAEDNFEETLTAIRRARSIQATAQLQAISAKNGRDKRTLDEINLEIAEARASFSETEE
ncbi:MAG: type II toxin-antitoxin system Phd/YefM family antitoxin [Fusobacteriaceae bacterium]|nr:type II toxin-antitoxin system Phd/YefM family antitoxin [Fusobacteriaceae bacterium]